MSTIERINPTPEQFLQALQKQGITDLGQLAQMASMPVSPDGDVAEWAFIVKGKYVYKDDA